MNTPKSESAEPVVEPFPKYTATERPVTRGDRIAIVVWIVMFLTIIAFTLIQYLLNWLL